MLQTPAGALGSNGRVADYMTSTPSYLFVILVSIVCVIMTAFSNSFSIRLLLRPLLESSDIFSRWCNCKTEVVVCINWFIRFEHNWEVAKKTQGSMLEWALEVEKKFANLQSIFSRSLSWLGTSLASILLLLLLLLLLLEIVMIRLLSLVIFLGRGGTVGFMETVILFDVIVAPSLRPLADSSELDSSCAAAAAAEMLTEKYRVFQTLSQGLRKIWMINPILRLIQTWLSDVQFKRDVWGMDLPLLYEFWRPLRRLIMPAAVRGLTYFCWAGNKWVNGTISNKISRSIRVNVRN